MYEIATPAPKYYFRGYACNDIFVLVVYAIKYFDIK